MYVDQQTCICNCLLYILTLFMNIVTAKTKGDTMGSLGLYDFQFPVQICRHNATPLIPATNVKSMLRLLKKNKVSQFFQVAQQVWMQCDRRTAQSAVTVPTFISLVANINRMNVPYDIFATLDMTDMLTRKTLAMFNTITTHAIMDTRQAVTDTDIVSVYHAFTVPVSEECRFCNPLATQNTSVSILEVCVIQVPNNNITVILRCNKPVSLKYVLAHVFKYTEVYNYFNFSDMQEFKQDRKDASLRDAVSHFTTYKIVPVDYEQSLMYWTQVL